MSIEFLILNDEFYLVLKMRINGHNTGIASECLILSKFYILELEAYLSQGNKKQIDIRVIRKSGEHISIDVKSVRGYSSLVVNNKFEDIDTSPDIFIVPSESLSEITEVYKRGEKRVMKGKLADFKGAWEYITG